MSPLLILMMMLAAASAQITFVSHTDYTLDVVPCEPGLYCSDTTEPCMEGSEHIIYESDDAEAFAVCSSSAPAAIMTRALVDSGSVAAGGPDVSYAILTPLFSDPPPQTSIVSTLMASSPVPVNQVSFQQFLALDTGTTNQTGNCTPPTTQTDASHNVIKLVSIGTVCNPTCAPGTAGNLTYCGPCAPGSFCSGGAAQPQPCPSGTYAPWQGASACTQCPYEASSGEGLVNFTAACLADGGYTLVPLVVPPLPSSVTSVDELVGWLAAFYGVDPSSIWLD